MCGDAECDLQFWGVFKGFRRCWSGVDGGVARLRG